MRTITNAAACAIVALSLGTAAAAATQKSRPAPRPAPLAAGPLSMDVAGVRLGMPIAAAQAALAGTYRCTTRREASFRQLVDREVAKRRGVPEGFWPTGSAIAGITCEGPAGEYMRLSMAQTPGGEIVDRIDLYIRGDRVDPAALVRQVEVKYGRPTTGTAANGSWCTARCGYDLTMDLGPRITTMSIGRDFKILGSRGRDARLADDAAVEAVAAREAPAAKRGAF